MSDPKDFVIENGVLTKYVGPSGRVVVPEGVTSIESYAFFDCENVTSIVLPEGLTSIGDEAFRNCRRLTSVTIPKSVTSIGESIFRGCSKLQSLTLPKKVKSLGKIPFYGTASLPKGLIPKLGSFYHALSDADLRQYALKEEIWRKLDPSVCAEIFIHRQGKTLREAYRSCIDEALSDLIGREVLKKLSGKASRTECKNAGFFMTTLYEKTSPELLKELYERLKLEKNGTNAINEVEENVALMNKLGNKVEADETLLPPEHLVMQRLIDSKMNTKDLEKKLKEYYGLTFSDLAAKNLHVFYPGMSAKEYYEQIPGLLSAEGAQTKPYVLAWLLTAHENFPHESYNKPGLRPEAAELVALLDPERLQVIMKELADRYLIARASTKKIYLAYPICRYMNEENLAELTKRAPSWRTRVSGDNAPPLRQLRDAMRYSDTRAAMLFAEKYHELDQYAELRGMSEDEFRDRYLSDVGLDEQGGKSYDLGDQTVTARLQRDLSFLIELPNGKTAKSLPKKGADEEKYTEARADLAEIRKSARKILKARGKVLFEEFLSGRKRESENWQEAYLHNPLLRVAAGQLVWAQGKKTFTLLDGSPINSAGKPYAITTQPIRLAHPMEMEPSEVEAWQKYISGHGIRQPFAQVWEPVCKPEDIRPDRYEGIVLPMLRFSGKEKHGIDSGRLYAYSEDIGFWLKDCKLGYKASTWRINYDGGQNETYTLGKFSFKNILARSTISWPSWTAGRWRAASATTT